MSAQVDVQLPWLGLLGSLVSNATDRDSSSADQAARVSADHHALFDVLMAREKKFAELIAATKYASDFVLHYSALTYSPEACKEANDRLASALAAVEQQS